MPLVAMPLKSLWSRLRRPEAPAGRPRLRVQTLGLSDAQVRALRPVLDRIGECLDLLLELDARQGDIVLAEQHFVRRTTPQHLASVCDARPLVTCDLVDDPDPALSALALFETRQRALLRQLRDLPMVRGLSPQFGASGWGPEVVQASQLSSGFDEDLLALDAPALDTAQQRFVDTLLAGLTDPGQAPMVGTYGPRAALRADFGEAYALLDPLALQRLRVHRELPRLVRLDAPGTDAIARELDELVWDVGIACGGFSLRQQPHDWWHTPLATAQDPSLQRYSRVPRHLELTQLLFAGRITPAEMQRQSGQSVAELRPFLQACLFLGLAWWSPQT